VESAKGTASDEEGYFNLKNLDPTTEMRSEKRGKGMEYPIFRAKEYSWQKFS